MSGTVARVVSGQPHLSICLSSNVRHTPPCGTFPHSLPHSLCKSLSGVHQITLPRQGSSSDGKQILSWETGLRTTRGSLTPFVRPVSTEDERVSLVE